MECQACGSTTNLIFCGANTVLCEECSKSDAVKELITTNRIGSVSESQLQDHDTKNSLFSFRGRSNRGYFWLVVISLFLINLLITFVIIQDRNSGGLVPRLILFIPSTWVLFATYVKRLHDLDMSAWLVITLFIPFINLLILLWLGFESGTKGPNDYGDEPTSIFGHKQEPPNHDSLGSSQDNFVLIRGGEFLMGSPSNEVERSNFETQHLVKMNDFSMSKYAMTVAEFKRFITESGYRTDAEKEDSSWLWNVSEAIKTAGINWCHGVSGRLRSQNEKNHPVLHVSWNDAVAYCQWLSEQTGKRYRLPTEAEWEYACRAGSNTPFNTGENLSTAQANYDGYYPYNKNRKGKSREYTVAVDSFAPNAWGLYNMHGNVWEWCDDVYGDKYNDECEAKGLVENPAGHEHEAGSLHVLRGGSWSSSAGYCRSASRISRTSDYRSCRVGFRPVYVR